MELALFISFMGVCFFISAVNFYFQTAKYRYETKEVKRNLPILKAPFTWLVLAIISALIIFGTLVMSMVEFKNAFDNLSESQSAVEQYNNDNSTNAVDLSPSVTPTVNQQ